MTELGALEELRVDTPFPGVSRRTFHSAQATVAEYVFEPGARFPLHRHPEEQVTLVQDGEVEFTAEGREQRLGPGGFSVVAGGVEHGIGAGGQGARFLAILTPRRAEGEAYTLT